MGPFRLVILDNVKQQLENSVAKEIYADVIFEKQKNFLRTDTQYVVTDKHDMIGTHYLIYDTKNFFQPQLVFAIRTTFLKRAQEHRLETPLMNLMNSLGAGLKDAFNDFRQRHGEDLVDCNAWFVDPEYSKKNSGLNLSDIGYFLVCMNLLRGGYDHFVGCTNEQFRASRWLESVGSMPPGLLFVHPAVPQTHRLILMENFNLHHFYQIYQTYQDLFENVFECRPESDSETPSLSEFANTLFAEFNVTNINSVAA